MLCSPPCRVFSCHLLRLCKLQPSLVVDQSHELLEFAGSTANVYNKEEIYTHVVNNHAESWMIPFHFSDLSIFSRRLKYQQTSRS